MKKYFPPSEEEIACCAFSIIARENPQLANKKWREAEAQLTASRKHEAGILKTRAHTCSAYETLHAA